MLPGIADFAAVLEEAEIFVNLACFLVNNVVGTVAVEGYAENSFSIT